MDFYTREGVLMDFYTRVKCPKCGGDVEHLVKPRIPPIHVTRCRSCDWSEDDRAMEVPASDIFWPSESSIVRQGWQCPVCHRVYSPDTVMCLKCGDAETVNVTYSGSDCTTGSIAKKGTSEWISGISTDYSATTSVSAWNDAVGKAVQETAKT